MRGRRLLTDSGWNLVGSVLPGILGLLLMPALIKRLGDEGMGTMGLAWATIGYASLLDFGLGRAITRFGASALARNDRDGFRIVLESGVRALMQLGAVLAVLGAVVGLYMVSVHLRFTDAAQQTAAWRSALWIAGSLPAVVLSAGLRGALEANGRFREANITWFPFAIVGTLGPIALVFVTQDVSWLIAVIGIARWGSVLAFAMVLQRAYPEWRWFAAGSPAVLRQMLAFGSWITLSGVLSPLMLNLDRFVIGSWITMAAVAPYVIAYELASKALVVPRAVSTALFPRFSVSDGADAAVVRSLYRRSFAAMAVTVVLGGIAGVLLAEPVLTLWVGAEMSAAATRPLQWFVVGMAANGLAHIPFSLLQGLGRADLTAKFHFVEMPIHLVLLLWLVRSYGVTGGAMAWALRAGLDLLLLAGAAQVYQRRQLAVAA